MVGEGRPPVCHLTPAVGGLGWASQGEVVCSERPPPPTLLPDPQRLIVADFPVFPSLSSPSAHVLAPALCAMPPARPPALAASRRAWGVLKPWCRYWDKELPLKKEPHVKFRRSPCCSHLVTIYSAFVFPSY